MTQEKIYNRREVGALAMGAALATGGMGLATSSAQASKRLDACHSLLHQHWYCRF